ncbi:hypothetical protein [Pseudomonas sp.]|uniref:hypothetical protein n=1 Tax=Pseudomonas sp. TaxID=306 RepID=UPI0039A4EE1E
MRRKPQRPSLENRVFPCLNGQRDPFIPSDNAGIFSLMVHRLGLCTNLMWRLLMSLQALWSVFLAYPAQSLNALALFFGLAGSWLLLATRVREQRAVARLIAGSDAEDMAEEVYVFDAPTQRLNRFFYRFGFVSLALSLALSWGSTQF